MKISIVLADPEEHLDVDFDARDRRAFEKAGGRDIGLTGPALIDGTPRMPESQLAWIAWHAAKRQELITMSYADFDARCAETNVIKDDEDAGLGDPTGPAASAG